MEFRCLEHGSEPTYISLGVSYTHTDGTDRDWHGVAFIVHEPDGDEITRGDIEFTKPEYVEDVFTKERVKDDMIEYFNEIVDEDPDQSRLAERGSCSERTGNGMPTCYPRVVR